MLQPYYRTSSARKGTLAVLIAMATLTFITLSTLFIAADCAVTPCHAKATQVPQQQRQQLFKEPERDVWKPFAQYLSEVDVENYWSVHDENAVHVTNDLGGKHQVGAEYKAALQKQYKRLKEINITQRIEFRFTERTITQHTSSEQGFYKYTYNKPNELPKYIYGRFHLMCAKADGKPWKIVVDYDRTTQEGMFTITEADFLTGILMEKWTER